MIYWFGICPRLDEAVEFGMNEMTGSAAQIKYAENIKKKFLEELADLCDPANIARKLKLRGYQQAELGIQGKDALAQFASKIEADARLMVFGHDYAYVAA